MSGSRTAFRQRIWERDGGVCHLCGNAVDPTKMHLDHVIPRSLGGETDEANLRVSHPICNVGKSNRVDGLKPPRGIAAVLGLAVNFPLRLTPRLHEKLKTMAEREHRSLHGQIVHLLEKAVEDEI
jgi:hypothetical protein